MRFRFNFIDNQIEVSDEYIRCIEVENNNYFWRIVNNLNNYCNQAENIGDLIVEGNFDIDLLIDYFNISNNSKKYITNILKNIENNIDDDNCEKIRKNYNKFVDIFSSTIYELDLPLNISNDFSINKLLKLMNISIKDTDDLLQNILTYIEISMLIQQKTIIFINLKSYLSKVELTELYKYCIYNKVKVLLIDNSLHGTTLDYEKKLIIDCNLEEYTL